MPNTQGEFNPAYSTVKAIYLQSSYNSESVNILIQNTECQFERLELVENVNDVFPNGVVIVRDTKDIVGRMKLFNIDKVTIEFLNGNKWSCIITSVSYLNNAASDTEENFVGIYISNEYYTKVQKTSLNTLLGIKQPNVYLINDFVDLVKETAFGGAGGYNDPTSNYVLYRPLNTVENREEAVADNGIEYLNYLASGAVSTVHDGVQYGVPQYMFWTEFDGNVNFKYFHRNPQEDPSAATVDADYRRIAVFNGDSVIQKLSDTKVYRKAYFFTTNPAYQFISKNYYYIKKTPKVLDLVPAGISSDDDIDTYNYKSLMYQFQDEGEKFNIELIDTDGTGTAIPGAEQIIYDSFWGYYDGLDSINDSSYHALIGQNFGTQKVYSSMDFMGSSGHMQFVDNTEMWKNMFDMTEVHPNYPDSVGSAALVPGDSTYLQKVMNIRYNAFLEENATGASGAAARLQQIREIELQNFIMYSLCCMGKKQEDCFFAALLRYEEDSNCPSGNSVGKKYRYKWNKLSFEGTTGATSGSGVSGGAGTSGGSCGIPLFYQIEKWGLDSLKSSATQDDTWAINLNERGLTAGYIPSGYISSCAPAGFKLRPIGAKATTLSSGENIFHVVKLCKYTDGNNVVYYFTAENAFDGCCISGNTGGNSGGNCGGNNVGNVG